MKIILTLWMNQSITAFLKNSPALCYQSGKLFRKEKWNPLEKLGISLDTPAVAGGGFENQLPIINTFNFLFPQIFKRKTF